MVKKILIKFISVILTLAMVISLLPAVTPPAWALYWAFSPSNNATGVPVYGTVPTVSFDELVYSDASGGNTFSTGLIKVYEGTNNSGTPLTEDSDFMVYYQDINNQSTFYVSFMDDLKYNRSYYVELQCYKLFNSDGKTIGTVEGVTFTTEVEEDYTATINTYKDGSLTALGPVELRRDGTTKYTMDTSATGVYTVSAANGTYDVAISGSDTGKDITIDGAPASVDLNYYTVAFDVSDAKEASGSTISATYGGDTLESGTVVLGGKTLVITARAEGAGTYGAYTYAWSGAGTNSQTSYQLTISSLGEKVDAICTVTGSQAVVSLGTATLIDGKYYFKDAVVESIRIKTILISFSDNVTSGDAITLPTAEDTVRGYTVSSTSNDYSKRINIDLSSANACEYYLRDVGFAIAGASQTVSVTVTTEDLKTDTFYNIDTEHYYQYIPYSSGTTGTWTDAYTTAQGMIFMDRTGYLATVKDKTEDQFLYELSDGATGWLGGTTLTHGTQSGIYYISFDTSSNDDHWYWACGPEIGNSFYSAQVKSDTADSDSVEEGYYFNWRRGEEPDNANAEQCLTTLDVSTSNGYAQTETGYQDGFFLEQHCVQQSLCRRWNKLRKGLFR